MSKKFPGQTPNNYKQILLRLPSYTSYIQGPHIFNLSCTPWIFSTGLIAVQYTMIFL